ncbi:MAG TPA: hypothetical protein VIS96_05030 [Terrimicrobiaceae bacterium]
MGTLKAWTPCVDFEIFVDGGIRSETAPVLAAAGADGIVPGSLVLKAPDPVAAVKWIHSLCRTSWSGIPAADGEDAAAPLSSEPWEL